MTFTDIEPTTETIEQQAGDLQRAREVTMGEAPKMEPPTVSKVELPRGLYHNGSWEKSVTIRELTGSDEEMLARQKDTADFVDTIIVLGTERIGSVFMMDRPFSERQGLLSSLLVGEREQIFLAVGMATFGDNRPMTYNCPNCGAEGSVDIDLGKDVVITKPTDLRSSYEYITSKGVRVQYRLVTGADAMEAAKRKGTSSETNTFLLSRVIQDIDGNLPVDPIGFARDLPLRDRRELLSRLDENQPFVDYGFVVDCASCGHEFQFSLSWEDVFRY